MLQLVGFQIAFHLLYEAEEAAHDVLRKFQVIVNFFLARQIAIAVGGADTAKNTLDSGESRPTGVR